MGLKMRAKYQSPTGEQLYRADVPHYYTLDQAAVVMAQLLPTMPTRFGHATVQSALSDAAAAGMSGRSADDVSEKAVAVYRDKLIALGVFDDPDAEPEAEQ